MKITEIDYAQIKSIGPNETCRAAVKVLLEDGESPDKAFDAAKACVRRQLGTQEKQNEEDKEKNRQREAMKGLMNAFGQPVDQYEWTAAKVLTPEMRQRPTQEVRVTNPEPTGVIPVFPTTRVPSDIIFRATREGITVERKQEIRAIPATDAEWNLTLVQQEIMNQHMRNIAGEMDRRFNGVTGAHGNIGTDIATAGRGGAGQDVGTIQIDEATQGAGNIPVRQPF